MNTLRRVSVGTIIFLQFFCLLIIPLFVSVQVAGNSPEKIKASLAVSGTYDSLIETSLLPQSSDLSPAVLSDPGIASALKNSVPSSYMQTATEKVIDNAFLYIHGSTSTLDLSIDVSEIKKSFADNVAAYVKQKFSMLPSCMAIVVPSVSIESLLQANCLPFGVSPQQASDYARSEITRTTPPDKLDLEILAGTRETSFVSSLTNARNVYPYFITLVYALPILSIVLATGVLFLSITKRKGVKRNANVLLCAGLINIVMALVALWFLGFTVEDGLSNGGAIASSFGNAVQDLINDLRTWWLSISSAFILVAIIIYIILGVTWRSHAMKKTSIIF